MFALLLSVIMCISLCACGGKENKDKQNNIGQLESSDTVIADISVFTEETTVEVFALKIKSKHTRNTCFKFCMVLILHK